MRYANRLTENIFYKNIPFTCISLFQAGAYGKIVIHG